MSKSLIAPIIMFAVIVVGAMLIASTKPNNPTTSTPTSTSVLQPFQVDEALPNVEIMDEKGQKIAISALGPQPILLNFWSTECSECAKELPELQQFVTAHPQFHAVVINVREEAAPVAQKLKELGVTLPSYRDNGTAFTAFYGTMPSSYFVKNNRIIYFFPGRINSTHLEALLKL